MVETSEDRRRFQRIDYGNSVSYKKLRTPAEEPVGALAKDLGEGGVRFTINEFLSLASRLVIEIAIPNSPKPIKAIAKVAWIRKTPMGDQYEIGNQFLDMTKEDKKLVAKFIDSASGTQTF